MTPHNFGRGAVEMEPAACECHFLNGRGAAPHTNVSSEHMVSHPHSLDAAWGGALVCAVDAPLMPGHFCHVMEIASSNSSSAPAPVRVPQKPAAKSTSLSLVSDGKWYTLERNDI